MLNLDDQDKTWLRWLTIGIFVVMALSDLLDGYLARRLHDESPLGRFLDPLADKLLITSAVLILGAVGIQNPPGDTTEPWLLPNWVVIAAIARDLVV